MPRAIRNSLVLLVAALSSAAAPDTLQSRRNAEAQLLLSSHNEHVRAHAYALLDSVWPRTSLYVCWDNPDPVFQQYMELVRKEVVETWQRESRLRFTGWQRCSAKNAGIRIRIEDIGPHVKVLGRALDGLEGGMVLNFTFRNWNPACQQTPEECIRAIAGHEFGHAIGLAHEQNRPDVPGECDEPPQGPSGDTLLTPYDKHSIMNYCNSKWNNKGRLSALDIAAVRELYGSPQTTQQQAQAPDITVQRLQRAATNDLEAAGNEHLRRHAYVLMDSVWLKPSIYVCWENPSANSQREMSLVRQEIAETWEHESRLRFTGWQQCSPKNAGIRIRIADVGPRVKFLGRKLDGLEDGMVLNFAFQSWSPTCQKTRDACIKAIAGHEFGHAIGLAHEQSRPDIPGECKKPAQGFAGDTLLTPYDAHSIMNYCNSEWNNDGRLSELDIDAVRRLYGPP